LIRSDKDAVSDRSRGTRNVARSRSLGGGADIVPLLIAANNLRTRRGEISFEAQRDDRIEACRRRAG